jgi:16S rRNA (adenine1518-N6/adenine1519-N6)-dimethyltransferase
MGKHWGQHFFWNRGLAEKIVNLIDIDKNDFVIEVGPGKGILTEFILRKTKNLLAIEIDGKLIELLHEKFPELNIINKDFIKTDISEYIKREKFKFVSNLPYKISSPTLLKFFYNREKFIEGVIVIQKELAERIVSKEGSKKYSPLSILLQIFFNIKIAFHLSPGSFNPPPQVDSSAIVIKKRESPLINIKEPLRFKEFLDRLFNQRRKKLKNNLLENEYKILRNKPEIQMRAEQLDIYKLYELYKVIYETNK